MSVPNNDLVILINIHDEWHFKIFEITIKSHKIDKTTTYNNKYKIKIDL